MSKYGLPKGLRLQWRKGDQPVGLMRVTESRAPWYLELRSDKDSVIVCAVKRVNDGFKGLIYMRGENVQNKVTKTVYTTQDDAKHFLDLIVVKDPTYWRQHLEYLQK